MLKWSSDFQKNDKYQFIDSINETDTRLIKLKKMMFKPFDHLRKIEVKFEQIIECTDVNRCL